MLTRFLGDYSFAWNPMTGCFEVRDEATGYLYFASEKAGRKILKCELDPMKLEEVWQELKR